jgi:phospholipase C
MRFLQSRRSSGSGEASTAMPNDDTTHAGLHIGRRQFLTGAGATAGAVGLGLAGVPNAFAQMAALPPPDTSGVEHIIVVMMENRSFDHYLGWLEGADGRQAGLRYVDGSGAAHRTRRLAPEFQGCGHPDPDHSYEGGRVEFNDGACDGWLRAGDNDNYAIGYYTKQDLQFTGDAAVRWTVCDRYFSAIMAPTFPNRMYQHAAQTDRLTNTLELTALPTIWDRLADAGVEGRYYFSDVPFLGLWGEKYLPIGRSIASFFVDARAGTLPAVSFVDPSFLGAELGLSSDDHPFADIRRGQAFLNAVYAAVTASPAWPKSLLVINYDEWGGFFDHVAPRAAPIPPADLAAGNADGLRGFRVPCLVISPFARREYVSSLELDHASILRMIEWRWGLRPLTVRDEQANNLAEVLDFANPVLRAKQFRVYGGPFAGPCQTIAAAAPDQWEALALLSASHGWPVGLGPSS